MQLRVCFWTAGPCESNLSHSWCSSKQSMIRKVSGLSTKTSLQSCCCFTSFFRSATRTSLSLHSNLGFLCSTLACTTPCLCPFSGSSSGVDGAWRPSWLRIGGVSGARTGAFAALSVALKSPCTSKYSTLHCRVRRNPLRILVYMLAAQHELPSVQACT